MTYISGTICNFDIEASDIDIVAANGTSIETAFYGTLIGIKVCGVKR